MATQPDPQTEGFSLADLADVDLTGIEEVRFVALPAGVFDFEITEAEMQEEDKDGSRRFKITFGLKILECVATLEPGIEKEKLAGKVHTERFYIDPAQTEDDVKKAIGRVRAFITDTGGDSSGKLGPCVTESKGRTFRAQIVKQKDKVDKSIEYARLKLDDKSKN